MSQLAQLALQREEERQSGLFMNSDNCQEIEKELNKCAENYGYKNLVNSVKLYAFPSWIDSRLNTETDEIIEKEMEQIVRWEVTIPLIDNDNLALFADMRKILIDYLDDYDKIFKLEDFMTDLMTDDIRVLLAHYADQTYWEEFTGKVDVIFDIKTKTRHKLLHHEIALTNGAFYSYGYWFRSEKEKQVYMELKRRYLQVLPNYTVKTEQQNWYEVDLLIEDNNGNKGVIELNGDVHNGRSDYDHKKRREIMDTLNLKCFEFYSNKSDNAFIVDDFLYRLNK